MRHFFLHSISVFFAGAFAVHAQTSPASLTSGTSASKLTVEVRSVAGATLSSASDPIKVTLQHGHPYQQGDTIVVSAPEQQKFLFVQVDNKVPESLIYCPSARLTFPIPFGKLAEGYDPEAFVGDTHRIFARVATQNEIAAYRNLALNSLDQRNVSQYFPHASASSVTRDDPQFFERNVIDGNTRTAGHGKWPYESWGNGLNQDPWIKIDFGRDVLVDRVRLYIRSDKTPDKNFGGRPHDTYWISATIRFSDGTTQDVTLKQSAEAQEYSFPEKKTKWLQIDNFKQPSQPLGFAAITEIEAYGKEPTTTK